MGQGSTPSPPAHEDDSANPPTTKPRTTRKLPTVKTKNRYTTHTNASGRTLILDRGANISDSGYADARDARQMCKELNRRHRLGAVDPRLPMDKQPPALPEGQDDPKETHEDRVALASALPTHEGDSANSAIRIWQVTEVWVEGAGDAAHEMGGLDWIESQDQPVRSFSTKAKAFAAARALVEAVRVERIAEDAESFGPLGEFALVVVEDETSVTLWPLLRHDGQPEPTTPDPTDDEAVLFCKVHAILLDQPTENAIAFGCGADPAPPAPVLDSESANLALPEAGGPILRYSFDGYPRENQEPAPGCEIRNSFKNHDRFDTWGGNLVGTRRAIVETLVEWGEWNLISRPLPIGEAIEMVEEAEEDTGDGDTSDEDSENSED